MSIITAEDIDRLAKASSKFARMIKCAEDGLPFDENVPGSQQPENQNVANEGAYMMNNAQPQQNQNISQGYADEYVAVPEEEMVNEEEPVENAPEDVGARAAQSFLAPFFDAAINGDQAAQDVIARAAGHIASSTAQAYSSSIQDMQANMQDMPQNADQNMDEELIANPEEEIASFVVPIKNENTQNGNG